MKDKLKLYITQNYEKEEIVFNKVFKKTSNYENVFDDYCEDTIVFSKERSVDSFIIDNKNENNFQKLLFKYIDDRLLKDSDVYNKVHIDRRLFSKIRNDNYHPSKETIILLGLSLNLSLDELIDLLDSASYSLPKNNYYDLIIRFCFIEGIYDIKIINDLLDDYNCKLFNY